MDYADQEAIGKIRPACVGNAWSTRPLCSQGRVIGFSQIGSEVASLLATDPSLHSSCRYRDAV
jgi:hypothetical protein